jgi:hypothetical protein
MDKLKTICLHLTEKRDKITQSMTLHKGLLSALWRLPNEVLSKIFIHCLPEASFVPPGRSSNPAPMLLTRICQRWRDVAVDTPSLWCKLYAEVQHCELFTDIYYSPDKKWHQQAFLFDLWFKRSQGRPIELELSGDTITDSLSYKLYCLVRPYNNRISSLLFHNKISAPGLFFAYFPVLQVLTMSSINQYQGVVAECISRLPSTLRSLIFRDPYAYGFHFDELLSFGHICAQLTNVTIGVRCPSTFLDLLRLGVNLSSATIHMKQKLDPGIRLRSFTHVKIHSLSISHSAGWTPTNPVSDLFNALSLPNLRVLDAQYMGMWPHEEFKAFLTRSNCPLERLTLAGGMTTDESRAEYIALIPSLQVEILAQPEHG